MTTITLTRNDQNQIAGLGEKDKRAYARFQKRMAELEQGECLSITVWFDRREKFHRLHFVILTAVFDAQEQFSEPDDFRAWVQVGAGHCYFVPGPEGRMCAIPRSIAWSAMDEAEFSEHHRKVLAFLRSQRCTRFLWPAVDDVTAGNMMSELLERFQ